MEISQKDLQIIEYAKTHSQKETGLKFGYCQANIGKILRKHGIKFKKSRCNMSKLSLNVEYFKDIDNERKAYWLGFICADGYILGERKLSIFVKDLEILEKFKKDINAGHKISTRLNFDARTHKIYSEYYLQIGNEIFVKYLTRWVTHNKTDVLEFPEIEEKYYPYFIAGLFDGDGSVYIKNNDVSKILCASLISTKEVLDFIQNYFEKYNIKTHTYTKVSENKDNVFKVYWYKDAVKVLDFIYQGDPEIYMSRKYNLYKTYRHLKPTRHRIQPILQYTLDGSFVKQYNSMIEAGKTVNVVSASICQAAKRRISCKKFYWIYYNEDDVIYNKIDINLWKKTNTIKAVEIYPNG